MNDFGDIAVNIGESINDSSPLRYTRNTSNQSGRGASGIAAVVLEGT